MKFIRLFFLSMLVVANGAAAQDNTWPSPEVAQMYDHGQDYMTMNDYKDAITTYKQAILLAPAELLLYKALANAYYSAGKYAEAEQTLTPVILKPEADAGCYQLLAASEAAQKEMKEARAVLNKGLTRYPASGLLYHESGNVYSQEKKKENALKAWLDGIMAQPACAANYREAALVYLAAGKAWGLLYGETYLVIAHDTTGDQLFKRALMDGYSAFFEHLGGNGVPQYGQAAAIVKPGGFEDAVNHVYSGLTPVVSDGITTENLTMARTRFLISWFAAWGGKYPYGLFSYQDSMIRSGMFDKYNEWLFGKAESAVAYDAWNTFHAGEMEEFTLWQAQHPFIPEATDAYNERDLDFLKKH